LEHFCILLTLVRLNMSFPEYTDDYLMHTDGSLMAWTTFPRWQCSHPVIRMAPMNTTVSGHAFNSKVDAVFSCTADPSRVKSDARFSFV